MKTEMNTEIKTKTKSETKIEPQTNPKTYPVPPTPTPLTGTVIIPGSKSITNRALLLGAMAEGQTILDNVLFSDDTTAFIQCLQSLGIHVEVQREQKRIILRNQPIADGAHIYVNSAGTAARFLTAYLGTMDGSFFVDASEQMRRRPMQELLRTMESLGARFSYEKEEGRLPYWIQGCSNNGPEVTIDGSLSSQFVSAVLLCAPNYRNDITIHIIGERTAKSYIDITMKMIKDFGLEITEDENQYFIKAGQNYKGRSFLIESDVSSACYFAAAAVITGGDIRIDNVFRNSIQGDIKFLEVMERLGAKIMDTPSGIEIIGPKNGEYEGIEVDMNDFSDQTMTMAAVAVYARSKTVIKNVGHIRHQESDRMLAIETELKKMGIQCEVCGGDITIYPGTPRPSVVNTYNDHRMAMAFSLVGLKSEGITIADPDCVSKTFADYFEKLEMLY